MESAKIKTIVNVVARSISEHVLLHLERYSRKLASIICWHDSQRSLGIFPLLPVPFPPFFPGLIGFLLQWTQLFNKSQDKAPI